MPTFVESRMNLDCKKITLFGAVEERKKCPGLYVIQHKLTKCFFQLRSEAMIQDQSDSIHPLIVNHVSNDFSN